MPRKPTGNVFQSRGAWYARVTLGADARPAIALATCTDEEQATERGALLARLAADLRRAGRLDVAKDLLERAGARDGKALAAVVDAVRVVCAGEDVAAPAGAATTFEEFANSWTDGTLHRLHPDHVPAKSSADDDARRLSKHVFPVVREVPLAGFTLDHAEAVMRRLPADLSPASRRHVAQLLHRILSIAVFPARILAANPLPRGFLPAVGPSKALAYLYPDEDRKLLACVAVPLAFRVLYGFLAREGMRAGEAAALVWSDVDLERGAITLDANKTDDPRAWPLAPGTARALAAWRERRKTPAPSALVFVDDRGRKLDSEKLAQPFRDHLALAKVDRVALHVTTAQRRRIRIHDLRGTFVTLALANGRTEAWVQDRTGHRSSVMLNRYRRAARSVAELGLGALDDLDAAIPELRAAPPKEKAAKASPKGSAPVSGAGADEQNPQQVPKVGLEPTGPFGQRILKPTSSAATGGEPSDSSGNEGEDVTRRGAVAEGAAESLPIPGGVEAVLAAALERASVAGRWDVVAQLARELEARRLAASPNVVTLPARRRGAP